MSRTILVVDHAKTLRNLIKFALTSGSYTILEACRGDQALTILEKQHVDLIITERHLPEMDGLELLQRIKINPATENIPVFMLTTDASQGSLQSTENTGAFTWIVKPLLPNKLVGAVHKILGG